MKKYKQFIGEAKKNLSLEKEWFMCITSNLTASVLDFIEQGYDINTQDKDGNTALMWVSRVGNKDMAEILLQQPNINVNIQDNIGDTALLHATGYKRYDIVELLLKHPKIDVNIHNDNYNTALIYSAHFGSDKKILKLFLKCPDIDVTMKNFYNKNFIDYLEGRRKFLIDYLLQKKILENERNDIIVFFNKYKLVHPKIKKEYPHIFTGAELNLL
jgi:hypothetical protein